MSPNVVVFLADDLGYDDLSCYGSVVHDTPNIDSLAKEGVRFTDCHSNGCRCSPTRAALLTGRYQQRSGVEGSRRPGMPADELTFAHLLRKAGYATGMFGKYHTGHIPIQSPRKMGFDIYRGNSGCMDHHSRFNRWGEVSWYHNETPVRDEEGYSTELITDYALDFMDRHRKEPFLLYVADWMVHFPWQGPDDPVDFEEGVNNSGAERKHGRAEDRKRAYREMVEAMDESVGRITSRLRELGLGEDTFLFLASDNGGHGLICDNTPLNGAKGSLLEGGHRIPAIAHWPGEIGEGLQTDETVLLSDLFPTILDIASIQRPADRHLDGHSLLPMLRGEDDLPAHLHFWRDNRQFAVRDGPWKLVVHKDGEGLFNLDDDLGEEQDLASEYPDHVAEMRSEFDSWCRDVDADGLASRAKLRPLVRRYEHLLPAHLDTAKWTWTFGYGADRSLTA